MACHSYDDLKAHFGHKIVCVTYGDQNVAVECETCGEVLLSFDRDEDQPGATKDQLIIEQDGRDIRTVFSTHPMDVHIIENPDEAGEDEDHSDFPEYFYGDEKVVAMPMSRRCYHTTTDAESSPDFVAEALKRLQGTVPCSICGNHCLKKTAHLHQGKWIGDECCWDERLRASE